MQDHSLKYRAIPAPSERDVDDAFETAFRLHLKRKRRRLHLTRLERALSIILAFGGWAIIAELNHRTHWVNPILLPSPWKVLEAGRDLYTQGYLVEDIEASVTRVGEGFLVAVVCGLLLGVLAGWSSLAGNMIEPIIELLRPIPPLAFLPLFVMWLGLGETSKVLFIAFVGFFTIYLNTLDAVRGIDPLYIRAAQSLGARGYRMYTRVVIPAALPQILTGLRLGFGMAFFGLVAAELIAASSGLGYRIQDARTYFRVDEMLFDAAVIGVIGFLINSLLRFLESRALRWQERREIES